MKEIWITWELPFIIFIMAIGVFYWAYRKEKYHPPKETAKRDDT